jgi:hypothetical protein
MGMHSPLLIGVSFGQVPGQVFTKKGLKEVKYEKYKSISILYPIDYQYVTTNRMFL